MGENTLRALTSDLRHLEAWSLASTGSPLPWPAPEHLALKFLAHHLWDLVKRENDPSHGMPSEVADRLRAEAVLRVSGPHAPETVKRRLASWGTLHRWRGLEPAHFTPQFKTAVRLAVSASARPKKRKSERAVTRDVIARLLATCVLHRLVDVRDRALLLAAFASGGRRRSEVAALRVTDRAARPRADRPGRP